MLWCDVLGGRGTAAHVGALPLAETRPCNLGELEVPGALNPVRASCCPKRFGVQDPTWRVSSTSLLLLAWTS